VPTGHIVYVRQGTLLALPFDLARNAAIGNPVSVVDGIRQEATAGGGIGFGGTTGAAQFTVSQNGLFAYVPQDTAASVARTLVWVDRHGRETPLPVADRAYVYPRISPDGTRIALDIRDQQQDIWTWDLSREILNRVTFDPAVDNNPLGHRTDAALCSRGRDKASSRRRPTVPAPRTALRRVAATCIGRTPSHATGHVSSSAT
jgi:eukaryotic-like serine/threonine-protein kinase